MRFFVFDARPLAADIGIGMGITGTDVTKGTSDMVLADDNFATIVNAVEEGRKIYDNVLKVLQFQLSTNLSEVIIMFIASILHFTILSPVHLQWSFFADSSYMLSFSVLCSCVCSRLISPSVSSWHKQDNTLMHQSPGHIQRRTPYNF